MNKTISKNDYIILMTIYTVSIVSTIFLIS